MIIPLGGDLHSLFLGIKEFPPEKIILVVNKKEEAEEIKKDIEKFYIPLEINSISGDRKEHFFSLLSQVKKENDVLMNLSVADPLNSCIGLSAAFAHGVKAFSVENNKILFFPMLQFSYKKLLTEKKICILKALSSGISELEKLAKEVKMSPSLLSYHLHGNYTSEGLKKLGLIETFTKKGKVELHLSELGKLLLKGHFIL